MHFFGDYHTHSNLSDGRQTISELVRAAYERGLREVAITDHGPMALVIGVKGVRTYLDSKRQATKLQHQFPGIRILVGAEANIRDINGTLDIPDEIISRLDLLIAGMHPYTKPTSLYDGMALWLQNSLRNLGKRQFNKATATNTKACIAAVENNPQLDILAHPGLFFPINVKAVAEACKQNGVLFEINCGHNHPPISDIMKAEQTGVSFIINSDAHFRDTVGELQYGRDLVKVIGIDAERVANRAAGGGIALWGKKGRTCTYSSLQDYQEPAKPKL